MHIQSIMETVMSKRFALFATAALLAFGQSRPPALRQDGENRHRWRCSDVSVEKHHQNAVNSKDHTTLVAAVKAAGLVDTLSGPGPFTVFAPTTKPSPSCRPAR